MDSYIMANVIGFLSEKHGDRFVNGEAMNTLTAMLNDIETYWLTLERDKPIPTQPKEKLKTEDRASWFTCDEE